MSAIRNTLKILQRDKVELAATIKQLTADRDYLRDAHVEACEALATAEAELAEARHEASCCDDIALDQPLAGIISDLQTDRERLHTELARTGEVDRDEVDMEKLDHD